MTNVLHVLVLEDNAADVELVNHELRRAGFEPELTWVDNRADFETRLSEALDLIIADYYVQQFDAPHALEAVKATGFDIPFIVMTGTVGQETVADVIRIGASDYVYKDRPERLGSAVVHALEQKRLRDANRQVVAAEREQRVLAEALREASAALNSTLQLDEVLDRILMQVERVLPYDAANVMLIEDGFLRIVRGRGYEARGAWKSVVSQPLPVRNIPKIDEVIRTHEPVVVPDTELNPDWVTIQETAWVRSFISAPLRFGEQVLGVLNIDSATPNTFTTAHLSRLQAFIDQASIAISNARLYEQVRRYADDLEARVGRRTEALRRANERLEFLFRATPAIIYRLDPLQPSNLTFLTPNVFALDGFTPEDFTPNPEMFWVSRVHPDDLPWMLSERENLAVDPHKVLEYRVLGRDGQYYWVRDEFRLIRTADGTAVEILGHVVDITKRKAVESELRRALEQQKELNGLHSRFASMISHDFRTPLSIIRASSDMLSAYEERMSPERKREHLEKIQRQVIHLTGLLDEILIISQSESVGATFQPVPSDLQALIGEWIEEIRSTATTHLIRWSVGGQARPVLIDVNLMKRAVSNLLTNAVKYSQPSSEVVLELSYRSEQITIQVRDQGIGIPAEDQEKLFQPFFRAANVGTVGGTGLGLAIVKQAVDAHGGTIGLTSEMGVGTTVTLVLPAEPL